MIARGGMVGTRVLGALVVLALGLTSAVLALSARDAQAAPDPDLKIGATIDADIGANVPTSERLAGVEAEAFIEGNTIAEFTTKLTGVQGTLYEELGTTVPRNTPITMCVTTPEGYSFGATIVNVGTSVADPEGQGRDCNEYTLTSQSAPTLVMVFDFVSDPVLKIAATINAGQGSNVPSAERLPDVEAEAYINGASIAQHTTTLTGVNGTTYEEMGTTVPRNTPVTMCVTFPDGYTFNAVIVNSGSLTSDPEGKGRVCSVYNLTSQAAPTMVRIFDFSTPLCDGELWTINMNINGGNGTGTAFKDVIIGTGGNDIIDALGGNDKICAGGGNDTITGGPGKDDIFGENGADDIDGGDDNDYIEGGTGDDEIDAGAGDDLVHGNGGMDTINGGDGDDRLYGDGGPDTLNGDDDDDRLFGNNDNDVLNGGAGNDDLFGHAGEDELNGDSGNDELRSGDDDDVLNGNGGMDTLVGGAGDDELNGGNGDNDLVVGQGGDDTMTGGAGVGDTCRGKSHVIGDTADATCEIIMSVP